jgi:hypothetical protein
MAKLCVVTLRVSLRALPRGHARVRLSRFSVELNPMCRQLLAPLLLGLLWCAAGCERREVSHAPRVRPAQLSSADAEIFDAVLPDLISNPDFDPAVGGRAVAKRQIILDDTTIGGTAGQLVERSELTVTRAARSQLRDNAVRRNPPGLRFRIASYQPADENVVVRNLSAVDLGLGFAEIFPDARGYVQPLLPAYTEDGRAAVFAFHFGPTPHAAVGCYLLTRDNGQWNVKQRWIAYLH